jgi:hypothetical protein
MFTAQIATGLPTLEELAMSRIDDVIIPTESLRLATRAGAAVCLCIALSIAALGVIASAGDPASAEGSAADVRAAAPIALVQAAD